MIRTRKFSELRLTGSSAECSLCRHRHVIRNHTDREGMSGVLCGACANVLWMTSIRHIYFSSPDPTLTVAERVAERERQERVFYDTLPPCPYCTRLQWETFLNWIRFPPNCRKCGNLFQGGEFRDDTSDRAAETAYWYETD